MHDFSTLVELLRYRAQHQPDDTAFVFLQDGETESDRLTFQQLDQQARAISTHLQNLGLEEERALLLYAPNLAFISAFFGCLYARVVPVPAYPPRSNQSLSRLESIIHDAQAKLALTTAALQTNIEQKLAQEPNLANLHCTATDTVDLQLAHQWQMPELTGESLAFLQYTSGSTGAPKGVMVSHQNLLHNSKLIHHCFQDTPQSRGVSWLPPYHDMGLIGGVLQPIYVGAQMTLMPPVAFLQRPLRWLQAIAQYRATTSGAPNFAYDLCVQSIKPEQRETLDLSCWQLAFSGAEPVRAETLDRFVAAFEPCGFRRQAFYPCYGMAETTLIATGGQRHLPPVVQRVSEQDLAHNRVTLIDPTTPAARTLVSSGQTLPDQKIVVVNPETRRTVAAAEVGEIWVAGPSVAQGYWQQADKTEQTFHAHLNDPDSPPQDRGPFLRTGDLGFLHEGELFVTGRHKDLIIIRGRNHYPQDIEATVEQAHADLRQGAGAAFSLEYQGEERLVITQEVQRSALRKLDADAVTQAIRSAVVAHHQLQPWRVVLLKTGSIPKTSSGKIQRFACRTGILTESLAVVGQWSDSVEPQTSKPAVNGTTPAPIHADQHCIAVPPSAPSALTEAIQEWLTHKIADLLGVTVTEIDSHAPFVQQGLDSLAAVRLSGELQDWLGRSLSPTLAYDYPSITALAQYLGQTTPPEGQHQPDRPPPPVAFSGRTEDIAVIGMGCRFPGAGNPEDFWQLLRSGQDAIREVQGRWSDPKTPTWGGFLDNIDHFDAQFFGISPQEAEQMDPQQRLLLEVGWEALEDAGLPRERLAQSATGVFIGISSSDYAQLQQPDLDQLSTYTGTGNAHSIAANRLSYLLDLRGPSMTVDTACSSSLVAVHLACQSIRQGECDQALAGGVNLILSPVLTRTFAQAGMLAADGRCKTFDQQADGYVRGEGCGVIVLKRLSLAQADGDPILAVVRGSAVNQDGRSNGLTAPNGPAQQAVIHQALAQARVAPHQISYVDAHGTGTSLGDPIEMHAIQAVLMQERPAEATCWVGSVKTNIGHLEAAAGIAGLIKVVLALRHGEIPPHLHLQQVNNLIELDQTPLAIPTAPQPWPADVPRRFAGVSSFGFGGTNAHVVLEGASPVVEQSQVVPQSVQLLTLSAKTQPALLDLAQRYHQFLTEHPNVSLAHLCREATGGRSQWPWRVAIATPSVPHLQAQLAQFTTKPIAAGRRRPILYGEAPATAAPIAFLFTGQGSQYLEMGAQLYESQPLFRQTLDHCDQLLRAYLDYSLVDSLYPPVAKDNRSAAQTQPDRLDQTAYTQPALFALEYALYRLWQSWGIQPTAVMGHSVGEYVAACVAGVFSLEDGLRLISARARLMQALPQDGAMVAVLAPQAQVQTHLEPYGDALAIAADNGPEHFVVSGARAHIDALVADLTAAGINMRWLRVSHAFHSPLMAPMLADFRQIAEQIAFHPPQLPLISNVTGQRATDNIATADYWCEHILQPVQFQSSLTALCQLGCEIFLEIGPKPILLGMARRCVAPEFGVWLPSLKPPMADLEQLLQSLGALYMQGYQPNWQAVCTQQPRAYLPLPTYPWQRQRYWFSGDNKVAQAAALAPTTQVVDLLNQGQTAQLTALVHQSVQLPSEAEPVLPLVVEQLVQAHQSQLSAAQLPANWLYQIAWVPQDIPQPDLTASTCPGLWVVVGDNAAIATALQTQLAAQDHACWWIQPGATCQLPDPRRTGQQGQLDPEQPEHWHQLWATLPITTDRPLRGIIYIASEQSSQQQPWNAAARPHCRTCLALIQSLLPVLPELRQKGEPKLWLITQGAVATDLEDTSFELNLNPAPLWGLGKVVALEHPDLWGGLLDVSGVTQPAAMATRIMGELRRDDAETQVVWRGQQRYVARLQRLAVSVQPPARPCCQADGTYLITGGLGALGLQVARWLVQQGARALILVGRQPPTAAVQTHLQSLREQGVTVTTVAADICDRTQLATLQTAIQAAPAPLRGLIHAAGILQDGTLRHQTWAQFAQVLAPKMTGVWHLHQLTEQYPLDFFVLFSSAAALLGSPGQGNYAAANAFMDAFAHWRRQQNLPALSINWGPWADIGMAAQQANSPQQSLAATGIDALPIDQALQYLGYLIQQGTALPAQTGVIAARWDIVQRYLPTEQPPFLTEILAKEKLNTPQMGSEPSKLLDSPIFKTLIALKPSERPQELTQYLRAQLAHVLHLDVADIDTDENLVDSDMDSLMTMELMTQLQRDLKLMLYPREFYERPRISALANYLATEFERSHGIAVSAPSPGADADIAPELDETLLNFATPAAAPPRPSSSPQDRLPGIIFILSSPRSGSTLLRVMLAGHPKLLSTPELHLLPFETMAERAKNLSLSHLGEGLQRVFMELKGLGVKASQALVQDLVNRGLPIKQVYAMLQEAAGSRLLVDKSPTYAMSLETLGRAEQLFTDAKYIHLVRHPYAMIESFVRMRMDKLLGVGDCNPYQLAESIWIRSNQNVLQFCQPLGNDRHYLLRYEDLVTEPTKVMEQVCAFLGIDFHPSILKPYDGQRMTDGVHNRSLSLGDPNFLKHKGVEKTLGETWKKIRLPHQLGNFARTLTAQLGYELPNEQSAAKSASLPLRETQISVRGLNLCLCHWGADDAPLVLLLHGILDQGPIWEPVATHLAAQGYHVVAPDLRGHGRSEHASDRSAYQLLDYLADLQQLVPTLTDRPFHLVGHSMGSVIAALYTSLNHKQVSSLTLLETVLPTDQQDHRDPAERLKTQLDYIANPPQHTVMPDVAAAAARLQRGTPSLSEGMAQRLAKRATAACAEGLQWRWDPVLRTRAGVSFQGTPLGRTDYLQLLARIDVPVTLIYGDRSQFNRAADLAAQQSAFPTAQRHVLAGGHNIHLDAASEAAQLIMQALSLSNAS